jgi:PAS domain S-box-containing protein
MLGRIWRLYIFLGVLTAVGLVTLSLEIVQLRKITQEGLFRTRVAQSYSLQLSGEVHKLAYVNAQYWLFKREATKMVAEGIWKERIFPYQDSLKNLIYSIQDERLIDKVNNMREQISTLQSHWHKGLSKEMNLVKAEREFDVQVERVQKSINALFLDKEVTFQSGSNALNQMREWIFYTVFALVLAIMLIGSFSIVLIYNRMLSNVERLNTYLKDFTQGNFPKITDTKIVELVPIAETTEKLHGVFSRLKNLAIEVGSGKFDVDIRPFGGKGDIGNEVTKMRLSLKQIVEETNERNWFNEGFALMGEILRERNRDADFYEILIAELVGYSGVTQGGIFAYNAHKKVMEMRASYAFSRQKYIIKEVEIGEGLVGRVWREKDIVHITDIPYDYAEISSGLGGAQPKSILVVPLITDGTVVGVMEFAHLQTFAHRQIEFMQRVADSIAATIVRIQIDEETKRLLDESQALAVRLQEQEEETRQSLEEVTTAQELMARNSYEMERQLQALDSVFMMMDFDMRGNFIRVNENLLNLSGYHLSELMNQHFSILLGVRANDTKVLVDWQSILQGNILSGEFVRYNKSGQKFWMYEVIYPLFNKDGKILKISSIGYEITKQKEQERQIHEQLKELQMSKRDVVNRIREVEAKASSRLQRLQTELQEQLKERDRIIQELKNG